MEPNLKEQNPAEARHFRQPVVVDGKPFVFEGDIPIEPDSFDWFVSIPNYEDELGPRIEAMLIELEAHPVMGGVNPGYVRGLKSYSLGEGKVGVIQIVKVKPSDGAPSIGIKYIQTETRYFPKDSGYREVNRLGSFLLDNLCTLADIKKWRIYLFPDDRGGKLTIDKIASWYGRRDFKGEYEFPKDTRNAFGTMQRWPKEADTTQIMANILKSSP